MKMYVGSSASTWQQGGQMTTRNRPKDSPVACSRFFTAAWSLWGASTFSTIRACLLISVSRYQVRAGILQAAHYGVPQKRRRFILLASQRGIILPSLPLPCHASPFDERHLLSLPIGLQSDRLPRRLRHLPEQMHVSVSEAIGDLPQWEWEVSDDGHSDDGPTQWRWDKLSSNKGLSAVLGPPGTLEYIGPPLTDYQRSMRRGSSGVTLHFTPEFSELQVRR
jgi:hypothetical protein